MPHLREIKKSRPRERPGVVVSTFLLPRLFLFLLSEMEVDAGSHHAKPIVVLRPRDHEIAAVEIDIEILDLGGPVLRQAELGAYAQRPADRRVRLRQPKGLRAQTAKGEAA